MTPYYEADGRFCACGCGGVVRRRFVSGHNRRGATTSAVHRARIGAAQRRVWAGQRERLPTGATRIDHDGYRRVKIVHGAGRWEPEHRLVIEKTIGRKLTGKEVVHHINGDRSDNRIENLYLCRNKSHHNAVHRSQDGIVRSLIVAGVVVFKDGRYETVL